jgi:hypothetical protein
MVLHKYNTNRHSLWFRLNTLFFSIESRRYSRLAEPEDEMEASQRDLADELGNFRSKIRGSKAEK